MPCHRDRVSLPRCAPAPQLLCGRHSDAQSAKSQLELSLLNDAEVPHLNRDALGHGTCWMSSWGMFLFSEFRLRRPSLHAACAARRSTRLLALRESEVVERPLYRNSGIAVERQLMARLTPVAAGRRRHGAFDPKTSFVTGRSRKDKNVGRLRRTQRRTASSRGVAVLNDLLPSLSITGELRCMMPSQRLERP